MAVKSILAAAILAATLVGAPSAYAQNAGRDARVLTDLRMRGGYLGVGITDVDADRVHRLKLTEERGVEVTIVEEGVR